MTKYAVFSSRMVREEIRPFWGCFPVVRETKYYVFISRKTDPIDNVIDEEMINKNSLICYSDTDISDEIKALNDTVLESYQKHLELVKHVISLISERKSNGN